MTKTMLDVTYDILDKNNGPLPLTTIIAKIKEELHLTDQQFANKISVYYTNLTLDGRFLNVGDGNWDLRKRNKFKKEVLPIDISDDDDEKIFDSEDEDDIIEDEEEEEEVEDEDEQEESLVKTSYVIDGNSPTPEDFDSSEEAEEINEDIEEEEK